MTDELSGLPLREAVARALGWTRIVGGMQPKGDTVPRWWLAPSGWTRIVGGMQPKGDTVPRWWLAPSGPSAYNARQRREPPPFESSLDACFGPGGPVEALKAQGYGVELCLEADGAGVYWRGWFTHPFLDAVTEMDEVPASALCRAFLAAHAATADALPEDERRK